MCECEPKEFKFNFATSIRAKLRLTKFKSFPLFLQHELKNCTLPISKCAILKRFGIFIFKSYVFIPFRGILQNTPFVNKMCVFGFRLKEINFAQNTPWSQKCASLGKRGVSIWGIYDENVPNRNGAF